MSNLRVSVLISTYNGEKYLEQQIESLLSQKNVEVDILVRDDGSTDGTLDILNRYAEAKKLVWYQGTENLGPAKSFLELVQKSGLENEYYAFCDQDDVWLENKLEVAIHKIQNHAEEPALYYSEVERVGSNLEKIEKQFKKYHTETLGAAFVVAAAGGCTMVWNRKHMIELKKYNPNYVFMHDTWNLFVGLVMKSYIFYDYKSYILYRQHENNVLGGIQKHHMSKMQRLKYKLTKFFNVSYSPAQMAAELLSGYEEEMDTDRRRLCEKILNSPKSLSARMKVIFDKEFHSPYFIMNMKFWIQVLRGRA